MGGTAENPEITDTQDSPGIGSQLNVTKVWLTNDSATRSIFVYIQVSDLSSLDPWLNGDFGYRYRVSFDLTNYPHFQGGVNVLGLESHGHLGREGLPLGQPEGEGGALLYGGVGTSSFVSSPGLIYTKTVFDQSANLVILELALYPTAEPNESFKTGYRIRNLTIETFTARLPATVLGAGAPYWILEDAATTTKAYRIDYSCCP